MKVSLVGAGLIGFERLDALKKLHEVTGGLVEICTVVDLSEATLEKVSKIYNCKTSTSLSSIFIDKPDWVFVCTSHQNVAEILKKSFEYRINVLVEKPLGRSYQECLDILKECPPEVRVAVGFNYRFYRSIEAAIHDARNGRFGKLISVNMVLGHGNSPGMEKSWKLDPTLCGGGALLDPGIHLLDLVLCLTEGSVEVLGGGFWDGFWSTGIEEEAHLILRDDTARTIFNIQASLNRWRSNFRLEINGAEGYGVVEGRGRSYGPQSYRVGKRWGWQAGVSQAESEVNIIDRDIAVDSFYRETASLLGIDIVVKAFERSPSLEICNKSNAIAVMHLLDRCQRYLGINSFTQPNEVNKLKKEQI